MLSLTGADFPELSTIDLQTDYVALKLFLRSSTKNQPPETIFLGRVLDATTFQVEASLPLSATSVNYEIYSGSFSFTGAIALK